MWILITEWVRVDAWELLGVCMLGCRWVCGSCWVCVDMNDF